MVGIEKILIHNLPVYLFTYLRNNHGIVLCFTTRNGGYSNGKFKSLNIDYYTGDSRVNVRKNREIILKRLGLKRMRKIYSAKQVHGNNILNINKNINLDSDNILREADCLITNLKDIPIMVMGADCNLILMADISKKVVAAIHAGWKGTLQELVTKVILYMKKGFGSKNKDIFVAFGPSIRKCCYKIDNQVLKKFTDKFGYGNFFIKKNNDIFLDLININYMQLKKSGISEENISDCGECTYCDQDFFSYRRNKVTGRQAGIAIIEQ
ncbi:MAG TPA: peptidoglycan editing factor PgeF [Candidatus Hydromicrobium sp.]